MERKIAFCVRHWSSDATLFSWTWAKQYFLRKHIDETGAEFLSPSDKLYVIHVKQGKDQKERAWSAGGPLLPSLQMALSRYPHTIVELEGSHTYSVLLDFTEKTNIDVLILGGKETSSSLLTKLVPGQMGLSQQLNAKAACLVIRPASARNDKMRINSQRNLGSAMEQAAAGPGARASLPQNMKANMLTATTDPDKPRKVVIAYDAFDVGRQMLTWAAKYCLASDDQLFLLQYQVSQKGKRGHSEGVEEGGAQLEQEDLMGLTITQHVSPRGDAKAQICEFCENESMDLLVVTSTIRGRLKKALSLMGGVSSQLVLEAPCPVLVLPTQASSFQEHNANLGSGELQALVGGGYEVSTSPHSQGANSPPAGRGPFQKLSSMKTRSGELPRPHSASAQRPISPQASGGSLPQPHQTSFSHTGSWGQKGTPQGVPQGAVQGTTHQSPFAHSHSWGPRTAPQGVLQGAPLQGASSATLPQGAVPGSLAVASSGQLGARAAPPATPPQQPGQESHVLFQEEQSGIGEPKQGHRRSLSQSQSISANIDLIAKLRRQLEERDAEIAALKDQVHKLQLGQSYAADQTSPFFSSQPMLA